VPQIEVTFEMDANGILSVSAEEKGTGLVKQITITNDKGRLSKDEIDRMVHEAGKFEAADKLQKERIEAKTGLENYAYSMKNTMNEPNMASKMAEADKKTILDAVEKTIQWLAGNQEAGKDEYEHKQKELEGVCNPIMTKVYQGMGDGGTGSSGGSAHPPGNAFPNGFHRPGRSGSPPPSGPKVEEVD
jgi:L1 cell adhesion molecule like protein